MHRACTHIARSPASLLELSRSLQRTLSPSANQVLLFAIAPPPNIDPAVLSAVASSVSDISPVHAGCISYNTCNQPGLDPCAISLAFVDGVSFRSAIPGRPEPQVGRWHAARHRNTQQRPIDEWELGRNVDWEKVWGRSGRSLGLDPLPDDLSTLDPSSIHNILYFSDKAPQGIASVLHNAFPTANKLSLIASSTPFLTGRPVTLFHNGKVHSDGAVGVALSTPPPPAVDLAFPPLVPLTPDVAVTGSEGNLILSLDFGNPTRLLLEAIQKHGLSPSAGLTGIGKEDEFYVGVLESDVLVQLHRINSGDPSRGTIALDTSAAPKEGSVVRLYHLPPGEAPNPLDAKYALPSLTFLVAPETSPKSVQSPATFSSPTPPVEVKHTDEIQEDKNQGGILMSRTGTFYAASENGFTLSRGEKCGSGASEGPWTCVVPGGRVGLMFPEERIGSEDAI